MAQSGRDNKRATVSGGHDFGDNFGSTLEGGSESLRSTLSGRHDFYESFESTLAKGSESLRSTLAEGHDFYEGSESTLAKASESLKSTLAGGHDFYESLGPTVREGQDCVESRRKVSQVDEDNYLASIDYACGQCDDQKPAVGFCKDCDSYLCDECYTTHLRPKSSRHHTLLDGSSMPRRPLCDPCKAEGKYLDSAGFCQDCAEYLCRKCFKTHLRPKPSRNHVLLDHSRMPRLTHQPSGTTIRSETTTQTNTTTKPTTPTSSQAASDVSKRACFYYTNFRSTSAVNKPQTHNKVSKVKAEYTKDITISTVVDERTPEISGMVVLMPGKSILVVDSNNSSVKLVDLEQGTVPARLRLPMWLWDITRVSGTSVAVTSWNMRTIYFIKIVDRKLKLDGKVGVNGECRGIVCIYDTLVVSYERPVKVELLNKSGQVLQTIVTQDTGYSMFLCPWYVEVSRDLASLYITDHFKNTITRLSMAGEILATYKDDKVVTHPCGLTTDKVGNVYVCGYGSDNVVQLTSNLAQPRQLLRTLDCVEYPWSVCICQTKGTLSVGIYSSDIVKEFTLKS